MRVVVAARCLNERELLPVFLSNVMFADDVLICDGGSTDGTIEYIERVAVSKPRLHLTHFPELIPIGPGQVLHNPEGRHVNYTLDAALDLNPDWVFFTEIDAFPSTGLHAIIRDIMEMDGIDLIRSWLLYVAPDGESYYPATMKGPGNTAWRVSIHARADNEEMFHQGNLQVDETVPTYTVAIEIPRIHLTWETEDRIRRSQLRYNDKWGWTPLHPDLEFGPKMSIPDGIDWCDPRYGGLVSGRKVTFPIPETRGYPP